MLSILVASCDPIGPQLHYTFLSIQTRISACVHRHSHNWQNFFSHFHINPVLFHVTIRSILTMCPHTSHFISKTLAALDCSHRSCWSPRTMPNFFSLTWWLIWAIIIILAPVGRKIVFPGQEIIPCQSVVRWDTPMMPMGIVYIIMLALPECELVFHTWDMVYTILNYWISFSTMIHAHLHGLSESLAHLQMSMQCTSLNRRWDPQVAWVTEEFSTVTLPFVMDTGYPSIGSQEQRQSYQAVRLLRRKPLQTVLLNRLQPELVA